MEEKSECVGMEDGEREKGKSEREDSLSFLPLSHFLIHFLSIFFFLSPKPKPLNTFHLYFPFHLPFNSSIFSSFPPYFPLSSLLFSFSFLSFLLSFITFLISVFSFPFSSSIAPHFLSSLSSSAALSSSPSPFLALVP